MSICIKYRLLHGDVDYPCYQRRSRSQLQARATKSSILQLHSARDVCRCAIPTPTLAAFPKLELFASFDRLFAHTEMTLGSVQVLWRADLQRVESFLPRSFMAKFDLSRECLEATNHHVHTQLATGFQCLSSPPKTGATLLGQAICASAIVICHICGSIINTMGISIVSKITKITIQIKLLGH